MPATLAALIADAVSTFADAKAVTTATPERAAHEANIDALAAVDLATATASNARTLIVNTKGTLAQWEADMGAPFGAEVTAHHAALAAACDKGVEVYVLDASYRSGGGSKNPPE